MGLFGQAGADGRSRDSDKPPGLIVQAGWRPDSGLDNFVERGRGHRLLGEIPDTAPLFNGKKNRRGHGDECRSYGNEQQRYNCSEHREISRK
jgi:hypothetical protein